MSININCKKKWHPSRYETRKQVEEVKQKLLKENEEVNKKNDETRRLILENKLESDENRMDWMFEQQIVSSVCLSRDTQITTALALYDLKTISIHYFTFKDDFLHFGLSTLILKEKITTLVVQKELAVIIDLFKGKINLVCVDRKNFNINPRILTGDYFSDSTVSSLLNYLNLNDHRIRELKIVRKHLPGTMYIPKDVITDLELLEKKTHSLLNLVNHTKTRFGLIKLKNNIVQPFANEEKIKQRQENILFFNENESLALKIENVLKDIPFTINILPEDFNTERKTLESLKKVFEDSRKLNKFILRVFELKDLLHSDLQLFKDFNESVINSKIIEIRDEFAKVFEFNEESIIKQGIDDYLDLARKIHNELYEDALKITEKLLVDKRFKMIKTPKGIYLKALCKHLIEQPDILKANKDHSINMLSSFQDENLPEFLNSSYTPSICSLNMSSSKIKEQKDFILLAKNKSYFLVVTKEIYRLNILLNGIHDQIIELEGEIALNLLKNIMKDLPTLIPICENIAEIDVCLSGYHFSQNYDCCIPKIDDFICISRSFYPPLKSSINNDYYVDKENLLNIITGPNMSGKSTYLKQFAYLTILTQIGYPITAKSAITKIFTGLYVSFNSIRIDLECMRELLKYHTSSSLIIIDEPGKGYDVDILTAFYSVLFDKLMITRPTIFFITHHYGIFKLNKCKKLNYLQVEQFKVKFGISKSRTGFKICEENIPKIYLDWL